MRKLPLIAAVAAMTATTVAPTAVEAHGRKHRHSHASQYDRGYDDRGYDNRYYGQARARCRSGTTGAILGAAAGALLGREVLRDKGTGTILGAAAGGLGGRALTRDKRCR